MWGRIYTSGVYIGLCMVMLWHVMSKIVNKKESPGGSAAIAAGVACHSSSAGCQR